MIMIIQENFMRLDKYLTETGMGSRSEVKQYIRKKLVTVNGVTAKSPDMKIDEQNDTVICCGRSAVYSKYRYFLVNKPSGCVSAVKDNVHKTVMELLDGENTRDMYPVGRLDIDTEGLLLITNDGELTHRLLSPAHHVPKTYYADIDGIVTADTVALFKDGVDIGDDKPTLPAELVILSTDKNALTSKINLTISEGRFHQVKRMFHAAGMEVTFLKRISMGPITLDDSLVTGSYRCLTQDEIDCLKAVD